MEKAQLAGLEPTDLEPLESDQRPRRGLAHQADATPTAKTQRNHRSAEGFAYLCHESTFTMNTDATVSRMGVWPPGAGLQGQVPNHPMLLRLRGVVVSVGASLPRSGWGKRRT
jgi:hypothetical protein